MHRFVILGLDVSYVVTGGGMNVTFACGDVVGGCIGVGVGVAVGTVGADAAWVGIGVGWRLAPVAVILADELRSFVASIYV